MRRIKSTYIYHLIKDACKNEGLTFTNRGYRAAKKQYLALPRTKRHLVM